MEKKLPVLWVGRHQNSISGIEIIEFIVQTIIVRRITFICHTLNSIMQTSYNAANVLYMQKQWPNAVSMHTCLAIWISACWINNTVHKTMQHFFLLLNDFIAFIDVVKNISAWYFQSIDIKYSCRSKFSQNLQIGSIWLPLLALLVA